MKYRAVVSLALAAALGAGLTACNYISPQRTADMYAASDGVHVTAGQIQVRNAMLLTDGEDTSKASLLASIVNHTNEAASITISIEGGASAEVELPKNESIVKVGTTDGEMIELTGAEFKPGQTIKMTFTPNEGETASIDVPVLDGTLAEYSTLVPTTAASPSPSASPAATETPATEEAPAEGAQG